MPTDVVDHFIAAIERRDLEHALTHLTDDCEYDNVPMGKVVGRDAVRATLGPFMAGFEEIVWTVTHQVSSGNLDQGVVMNERLDRFRAGDRWLELPVAGLFVVRHGQIALWRDYFDRDQLLQQMASFA
ncbi:MAG: nuclear transport factor 2 family protein [Actinobacteria bacterium]|nr:nuclear transport factor 2 family protein [Actinomycetota bacterium]